MRTPAVARHASKPGFGAGVRSLARGFQLLLADPSMWPWALVPAFVLICLVSGFGSLTLFVLRPWLAQQLPEASSWYGRVGVGAATWTMALLGFVLGWVVSVFLAPVLSAPALERITSRVEAGLGVPARPAAGFIAELWCGLRAMAGAALIGGPILLLLTVAELVAPAVAVFSVPAKLFVSSLFVAWGLFDYPLTLRGVGFGNRLRLVAQNFSAVLGFGLAFTALFWVPCCGVALLPVGVAAAAELVVRIERGT